MPRYKMKPGWMLGPSANVGDAFMYMIYPHSDIKKSRGRIKHIHRSVVRVRDIKKDVHMWREVWMV